MCTTAYMMCISCWLNICANWCTYVVHTTNISYICAIHVTWGNYTFFTHLFLWEIYFKSCADTSTYDAHLWWISLQKLNDNHTKWNENAATADISMTTIYTFSCGISTINLIYFYNCIQVVKKCFLLLQVTVLAENLRLLRIQLYDDLYGFSISYNRCNLLFSPYA